MEANGRVLQVNVSAGGVPKLPVERAWVGRLGVEGDGHREKTVHGGPRQALCLFSIEAIERLQSEGHPIEPGGAGENLTTSGVEWSLLPLGTRAKIGTELEIELASSTTPCETQARNFHDGRFSRINVNLHPSDSRMYARVLREGEVRPGDPINIRPPAADSRALEDLMLYRLGRAEAKSAVAAWRAAADAGFDVRVTEDGDLAMVAAPQIPGPVFNHAIGLAWMPHLVDMATAFFDLHGTPGWLTTEGPPWPDAERGLVVEVFGGDPASVPDAPLPAGVTLRRASAEDGDTINRVHAAAASTGISPAAAVNPWPHIYTALAGHPQRVNLIAELGSKAVGTASIHTHRKVGWLRAAAVVPEARGKGLQRALIAARVRLASERGCDLVGSSAEPGGVSAANLERMGLSRLGTRGNYLYTPPGVRPE